MKNFIITTDSTCDLPDTYLAEHGIEVMSLTYTVEGVTYERSNPLPVKEFYDAMRNGALPTTSLVNPAAALKTFEKIVVEQDVNIIHIAFSSGLSGSYNSAKVACEELAEKYPDNRIAVVDSLCASMGEGLIVYKAISLKEAGKSMDEVIEWLENNKLSVMHTIIVDDLKHLQRGGRISKSTAVLGSMLSIKPFIAVDNEGKLNIASKGRGRKNAIKMAVDILEEKVGRWKDKNDIICICHGDCVGDAQYAAELIKERLGYENFIINYAGPTIGAHTGQGLLGIFYMGDER